MEKPERWTPNLDTKSERRFLLIDWLMGVEQNSVYLSRILVVGCGGLYDCEELVGWSQDFEQLNQLITVRL